MPTSIPTTYYHRWPTAFPSAVPTSHPTSIPSSVPSSSPTLGPSTQVYEDNYFQNITSPKLVNHNYREISSNKKVLIGGFEKWLTYVNQDLYYASLQGRARNVSIYAAADRRLAMADRIDCTDQIAANITKALIFSSVEGSSFFCNGNDWRIRRCGSGQPSVCINCVDPCSADASCNSTNPYFIGPTESGLTSCPGELSNMGVLLATFEDTAVLPRLEGAILRPFQSSTTVNLLLSSAGTVYCAVFEANSILITTERIMQRGHVATATEDNLEVEIEMTGLFASTEYEMYCMTSSVKGDTMSITDALNTKMSFNTSCCRPINVEIRPSFLYQGSFAAASISISIEKKPTDFLEISIRFYTLVNGIQQFLSTDSPLVRFTNSVKSVTALTVAIPVEATLAVDTVFVDAQIGSSDSAADYSISFKRARNFFEVIAVNSEPPPPVFIEAIFSTDGATLLLEFDSDTNQLGSFSCTNLFQFLDDETSVCRWSSASSVTVQLPFDARILEFDVVSFVGSNVRAKCPSTYSQSFCDTFALVSTQTVSIQFPSTEYIVAPTVVVSSPSFLGECDPLSLDVRASYNSGNRPWTDVSLRIIGDNPSTHTAMIDYFVDNYVSTQPTIIPSDLLLPGNYEFSVELCNFMGKCSQRQKKLTVNDFGSPIITIDGSVFKTVHRATYLNITGDASYRDCEGVERTTDLFTSWSIVEAGEPFEVVSSYTQETDALKVLPYRLSVDTFYEVTYSVLDLATNLASSATVTVYVEQSELQAIIAGGNPLFLRANEVLSLDASRSRDLDFNPALGVDSDLEFVWDCASTAPVISDSCSLNFINDATSSIVNATAGSNLVGNVFSISVVVSKDSRVATASVSVVVVSDTAPVVKIQSLVREKVNVDQKLKLLGSVIGLDATAVWNVNDTSIDLIGNALTSIEYSVNTLDSFKSTNLVLSANSLPSFGTLAFSLTCTQSDGTSATSHILVELNGAPRSGSFQVTPPSGFAIVDPFTLSVAHWTDSDLPISFVYGYSLDSTTSNIRVLRSQSEKQQVTTALPAGRGPDHDVYCTVQVIDALGATTVQTTPVTVEPSSIYDNQTAQNLYIVENITEADYLTHQALQSQITIMSDVTSYVNCDAAPDCFGLNRQDCAYTENTCGACLSGFSVGQAGDSNTACFSTEENLITGDSRRLQIAGTIECSADTDCNTWQTCDVANSVCVSPSQVCKNSCSGRGSCSFWNFKTGAAVSTCPIDDVNCEPQCTCDVGFGGEYCQFSSGNFVIVRDSKVRLINALAALAATQDRSRQAMMNWKVQLETLTTDRHQLDYGSIGTINELTLKILSGALEFQLSVSDFSSILSSISMGARIVNSTSSSAYQNYDSFNVENNLVTTSQLMESFLRLALFDTVNGENDVEYTASQLKVTAHVANLFESSNTETAIPLSSIEQANGISPSIARIRGLAGSNAASTKIGLTQISPYGAVINADLNSDTLMVHMDDLSTCTGDQCTLVVIMRNNAEETYVTDLAPETFTTKCTTGEAPRNVTYQCTKGLNLTATCDGEFNGNIFSECPYDLNVPTCSRLVENEVYDDVCRVLAFSSTMTSCSCDLKEFRRRRALESLSLSDSLSLPTREGRSRVRSRRRLQDGAVDTSPATTLQLVLATKFVQVPASEGFESVPLFPPTPAPTIQPTALAGESGNQAIALDLNGTERANITIVFVVALMVFVVLTLFYVMCSNRVKAMFQIDDTDLLQRMDEDNQEDPAYRYQLRNSMITARQDRLRQPPPPPPTDAALAAERSATGIGSTNRAVNVLSGAAGYDSSSSSSSSSSSYQTQDASFFRYPQQPTYGQPPPAGPYSVSQSGSYYWICLVLKRLSLRLRLLHQRFRIRL